MTDFTDDLKQAHERTRQVEIDGSVFILQAHDPYGFWKVTPLKGAKHKVLDGLFTSYEQAHQACSLAADYAKNTVVTETVAQAPKIKRNSTELRD